MPRRSRYSAAIECCRGRDATQNLEGLGIWIMRFWFGTCWCGMDWRPAIYQPATLQLVEDVDEAAASKAVQ